MALPLKIWKNEHFKAKEKGRGSYFGTGRVSGEDTSRVIVLRYFSQKEAARSLKMRCQFSALDVETQRLPALINLDFSCAPAPSCGCLSTFHSSRHKHNSFYCPRRLDRIKQERRVGSQLSTKGRWWVRLEVGRSNKFSKPAIRDTRLLARLLSLSVITQADPLGMLKYVSHGRQLLFMPRHHH